MYIYTHMYMYIVNNVYTVQTNVDIPGRVCNVLLMYMNACIHTDIPQPQGHLVFPHLPYTNPKNRTLGPFVSPKTYLIATHTSTVIPRRIRMNLQAEATATSTATVSLSRRQYNWPPSTQNIGQHSRVQ